MNQKSIDMYNYLNLAKGFSNKFGLDKDIFKISFWGEKILRVDYLNEDYDLHPINNEYFFAYQYKQNPSENWEAITLHIKTKKINEILFLLKEELDKIDESILDDQEAREYLKYNLEYEFHYFQGNLLLINGIFEFEESFITISKIKTTVNRPKKTVPYLEEVI